MRIVVEQVERTEQGSLDVVFRSSIGQGRGVWILPTRQVEHPARSHPPRPGVAYDVEFTLPDSIHIGKNATLSAPEHYAISTADGVVRLRGLVEGQDDDGLVWFRLARDSVNMLDCDDVSVRPGIWIEVTVVAAALQIFPIGC